MFMPLKASGFQGIIYDYISILISFFRSDVFLLLGAQGMPMIYLLNFIFKKKIIVNSGGVEWEREKFGFFSKWYLKLCFDLCFKSSNQVIIDNDIYKKFIPVKTGDFIFCNSIWHLKLNQKVSNEVADKYSFLDNSTFTLENGSALTESGITYF